MTDGRGQRECRGDLVARERRGELSASDRIALGAHLEACTTCRLTREIHADFEAEPAVQLDDAARIARMSAAARRWSQRRARPRARTSRFQHWRRTTMGVAALLLLAGSASATAWWWRTETRAAEERAERATTAARLRDRVRATRVTRRAPAPAPVVVAEAPRAPEAPLVEPEIRRPRPRARTVAALVPQESAATLLRRADEARRRGAGEEAIAIYRRLQRDFADSREAVLSTVPLGGLLLRQGQATRAGEQFDRYLGAEPHGNLLPEALYGRGRAQAALGQREGERQTWRRMLDQAPGSAYEPHARRRLSELQ
jgi:tetratricopeptide repeat protein